MNPKSSLLALGVACSLVAPAFAQSASDAVPALEATPAPDQASATGAPEAATPALAPEAQALPAPLPEPAPLAPTQATPASPGAPVAVVAEGDQDEHGEQKSPCIVGDLCMGPLFSLGAINALGVGAHARYGQHLGFGLDYQWVPTLTFGDASAGWSLVTAEGRWYPFGGAFWMGGGFAYQRFTAAVTGHMNGQDVMLKGALGMPAFKFGLGFMGHDGFVMGIDLDVNVPMGGTHVGFDKLSGPGASFASADTQAKLQTEINSAASKGVKMIPLIPQLNLIRIGYLF